MNPDLEVRSYQTTAVQKCVAELNTNRRAQCHMAPGAGKTVVALLVKEELAPSLTIFFVPSIQLIHQQYLSWAKFNNKAFDALVVTSGRMSSGDNDTLELLEQSHIGTTTNVGNIKHFLSGRADKVIFSTYHSTDKIVQACKNITVDLAIFDEAHHVAGGFDKIATRLLNDDIISIDKRLFVTATPRLNVDEEKSLIVAGMDNIELFGEVAYKLSFREAVRREILCDFELIAATITRSDIDKLNITASDEEKIAIAAIKKVMDDKSLKRGLSFHSQINRAVKFATLLEDALDDTYVSTLNSSHSAAHRSLVIDNLKTSERGILTNVRVLGEGFDYAALDFIVMVDPKKSPVQLVQNIGRVMRKHKDKEVGSIIVPIFVEDIEADVKASTLNGRFMPIYRIATALGTLDSMLGAEIASARTVSNIDTNHLFIQQHLKITGAEQLSKEELKIVSDQVVMYSLYGTKAHAIYELENKVRELVAFCEKHDRLPSRNIEGEKGLTSFYTSIFSKTCRPETRVLLDIVRNRWGRDTKTVNHWGSKLNEIVEYFEEHGCRPTTHRNPSLANIMKRIETDDLPESVDGLFNQQIEAIKQYPTANEIKSNRVNDVVEQLEEWTKKHKRLPRNADVASNEVPSSVYRLLGRRNTLNIPDIVARINVLVSTYGGVGKSQASNKDDSKDDKIKNITERNKGRLTELEEFIETHGVLPTPKTSKQLYTFTAQRYNNYVNPLKREVITETIDRLMEKRKH